VNSNDWLLLVAHLARPHSLQPVQLQKVLFLLDKKLAPGQKLVERIYAFEPYDYGPFDSTVYSDAEAFAEQGLMQIQRQPGQTYRRYAATDAGSARAQQIAQQLSPPVVGYAQQVVTWVRTLSFNQLVSAIYTEYPEMKANSVFRA
jgi:uncharacterized protein YwgA